MKLYITRHGQTDWNRDEKIQGKTDIELNDNGRKQAQTVADQLKDTTIDMIFSSPLTRAVQTAQIINQTHQLSIRLDDRLAERGFGDFEGTGTVDFDFCGFWNRDKESSFTSCESTTAFFARVYDFIDECRLQYPDQTILVVAHGGVSLPFYTYAHGIVNDHDMRKYMLKNCEVAYYEL